MTLDITIHLQHPDWKKLLRPYCRTVQEVCELALQTARPQLAKKDIDMAVVLADDRFIRELNRNYRGKDKATNVLSFPQYYTSPARGEVRRKAREGVVLGDLVLSLETILREAKQQEKTPRPHAIHMLVHGTLHLLGHDHEREKEAVRMEALEVKILKKLSISNPYLSE